MQNLITSDQARKITGGRTPLTLESYERACTALQECIEVVDTMQWANLADAYAASNPPIRAAVVEFSVRPGLLSTPPFSE